MYICNYITINVLLNKCTKMRDTTETATNQIMSSIDEHIWDAIAVKAINRMAPHKMTKESVHMFNDFTRLTSVQKRTSGTGIKEIHESLSQFKENYIVGTSKIVQRTIRSCSQKASQKSQKSFYDHLHGKKHRVKTYLQEQDHHPVSKEKGRKVNNFFKLTLRENHNEEEEKIDEVFRNTKTSDQEYIRKIEQTKKELEVKRQHRTVTETKRFKEMKVFTYDFQGRLLSRGQQKLEGNHHVINMKPQFTEESKTNLKDQSRKTSGSISNEIVNKKVIQYQKQSLMDLAKNKRQTQLQQQKTQRRNSFIKNISLNKFQNIFNKQTRLEVGVSITDMDNRSKFAGTERDKSQKKNLKLLEYRDQTKLTEYFPTRKNLQIRVNTTTYKTQGDESIKRDTSMMRDKVRMKTQGNQISSKMSTSYRRFRPGRGIIHINHPNLYRDNFSPSALDQ